MLLAFLLLSIKVRDRMVFALNRLVDIRSTARSIRTALGPAQVCNGLRGRRHAREAWHGSWRHCPLSPGACAGLRCRCLEPHAGDALADARSPPGVDDAEEGVLSRALWY